jgi:hypothetical protein
MFLPVGNAGKCCGIFALRVAASDLERIMNYGAQKSGNGIEPALRK